MRFDAELFDVPLALSNVREVSSNFDTGVALESRRSHRFIMRTIA